MAGKPWSEERKAQAAAKRAAAKPAGAPKRAQNRTADNRLAVETALNTLSVPVMLLGRVNESFLADALTMQLAAEPLGAAAAEVAKVNPAFEQFLSRGAPATPYLLLGTTLLSIGAQLAVNHGVKLGPLGGSATPRGEMIAEMKRRMADAEQAAAAQDAAYARMEATEEEHRWVPEETGVLNEVDPAAMSGADAYEDSLAM